MNTNNTPAQTEPEGIPDALKLTPERIAARPDKPVAQKRQMQQATTEPTKTGRVLPSLKAPSASPTKPRGERKAASPKPAARNAAGKGHKPSTITRTDANPAKSIVPVKFKQQYAAHNDTCGDKIGLVLKEATTTKNEDGRDVLDIPALKAVAKANGIEFTWDHLNNGQKRMNLSNKLRGLVKAGKTVVIGKTRIATNTKPEAEAPVKAKKGEQAQAAA